jgi:ABC-type phosphate/phosphonate transport system substrate-binding protein
VLDLNWARWQTDGTADPGQIVVLTTTGPFDHCNFTCLESFPVSEAERWTNVLYQMSYANPEHREMMDLEGLQEWLPGRITGYADLQQAVEETGYFL